MLQNFPILYYLLASVLLYWVMLLFASLAHARGWTPLGFLLSLSNRDKMPDRTLFMGRADRAAKNMGENLLIFAIVALTAVATGASSAQTLLGAQIFFFSRLIYWPLYLSGVAYARTLVWMVSLAGTAWIALAIFRLP